MEVLGGEKNCGELSIVVKAKTFTCSYVNGEISLKEIHRKGERELKLSLNQANWISMGMLQRSRDFGSSRRRESQAIDGMFVSLIEGSNKRGCFLSIQTKQGKMQSSFLVVPVGKNGQQWWNLAKLISDVGSRRKGALHTAVLVPLESFGSSKERSYAQAVAGTNGGNHIKLAYNHAAAIEERIKFIEHELLELRNLLRMVFESPTGPIEKKDRNREILLDPTVSFDVQRHVDGKPAEVVHLAGFLDQADLEAAEKQPRVFEEGEKYGNRTNLLDLTVGNESQQSTCLRTRVEQISAGNIIDLASVDGTERPKAAAGLVAAGTSISNYWCMPAEKLDLIGLAVESPLDSLNVILETNPVNNMVHELTDLDGSNDADAEPVPKKQPVNTLNSVAVKETSSVSTAAEALEIAERVDPEICHAGETRLADITADRLIHPHPTAIDQAQTLTNAAVNGGGTRGTNVMPKHACSSKTNPAAGIHKAAGKHEKQALMGTDPERSKRGIGSVVPRGGQLVGEAYLSDNQADPNIESVIWDDHDGVFVHLASGLRYWPKCDTYFSYVSHEEGKERGVFYNFVDGAPVLCQEGILGESNEITLEEQDWDRNAIFTEESEGYHPDLENFFRARIDRGKNEN